MPEVGVIESQKGGQTEEGQSNFKVAGEAYLRASEVILQRALILRWSPSKQQACEQWFLKLVTVCFSEFFDIQAHLGMAYLGYLVFLQKADWLWTSLR
jgi:hypothetical protein